MQKQLRHNPIIALCLGVAVFAFAGWAGADPPSRVGRLSYISGAVSFSPAGEQDWVEARINRPLITGDRLWVDASSRAELQAGSSVIRMGENTSVTLLNLNDRVAQVQLAQGTLNIRVRRLGPRDVVEVDTPNLAYEVRRPGRYRLDVDPAGRATTAIVRDGQAEVYGDGASYIVNAGQTYRFFGTDLRDYEYVEAPRTDAFDSWSYDRDRRGDRSVSARYVSRDVMGYEDLDEYGSWRSAEGYGNVWVPTRVAAGWTPYHDGHWSWVEPWGWTWVDDAPWGFAVSHYGRWANLGGTWGWVPGPIRAQPVYAPALVAFIGGDNFRLSISIGTGDAIGWFPLGPRDVYRPSYPVSRGYFNNVNTSNTTVNTTTITNVYNNTNVRNITYVNQQVPGAVTAVPTTAFVQSQPVAKHATQMSREQTAKAPVTAVAAVAPVQTSVHGGAPPARKPPAEAQARPVVARTPSPPPPVPFSAKQHALAADPGKPLAAAALAAAAVAATKAAAPAPAQPVKIVAPTQPAVAPPKQQAAASGVPQPPEAQKGPQPPEAQKGPPPEAKKAAQPPEAQKGSPPPEAKKEPPSFESKKGPQAPETQKAPPPPVSAPRLPEPPKAPAPPVSVPRPPEPPKAPPPEVQKAPSPPVSAPRPPESPKAPLPVSVPRPPESPKAPPPEVQRAPSPPVSAPRPPEPPKAPPPVSVPRPPEAPKGPPPEAQKAPPPKPVARPPEKKDEKKGEEEDRKK